MLSDRVEYLAWAAKKWLTADTICPACGSSDTKMQKRKYLVTGLYKCNVCHLMFRVPQNSAEEHAAFYQEDYTQGFTTDCPDDAMLATYKATLFKDTEKDYQPYIDILAAIGVRPGQSLFDFGCSWGYGSWQFQQAGYEVTSYEVSAPRARFAAREMDCQIVTDPMNLLEKVDCFFTSHVIEHLPNPRLVWEMAARALKPDGVVTVFMPNGSPARKNARGYHQLWGKVHPLLISAEALSFMAAEIGFIGTAHSRPYDAEAVAAGQSDELLGDEMLFVARFIKKPNS